MITLGGSAAASLISGQQPSLTLAAASCLITCLLRVCGSVCGWVYACTCSAVESAVCRLYILIFVLILCLSTLFPALGVPSAWWHGSPLHINPARRQVLVRPPAPVLVTSPPHCQLLSLPLLAHPTRIEKPV